LKKSQILFLGSLQEDPYCCYIYKDEVKDNIKSVYWLTKAAENGHVAARRDDVLDAARPVAYALKECLSREIVAVERDDLAALGVHRWIIIAGAHTRALILHRL
jgi:hypothetical protein